MPKTLTVRLDEESRKELARLSKTLNKTESEVVRLSIHLIALSHFAGPGRGSGFIGLGQFASRVNDLASNKKHLSDFGQ